MPLYRMIYWQPWYFIYRMIMLRSFTHWHISCYKICAVDIPGLLTVFDHLCYERGSLTYFIGIVKESIGVKGRISSKGIFTFSQSRAVMFALEQLPRSPIDLSRVKTMWQSLKKLRKRRNITSTVISHFYWYNSLMKILIDMVYQ